MQYLQDVRYLKTRKPFDTIRTKKRFRARMIEYYFDQENSEPLMFKLIESPNDTEYEIIPYITLRGNPSICFVRLTNLEDQEPSDPSEL